LLGDIALDAHHILEEIAKHAAEVFRNPVFAVHLDKDKVRIQQGSDRSHLFATVHPCTIHDRVKLLTFTDKGALLQALLTPEDCKLRLGRLAEVA
jgi:hypothetical protein